MPKGNAQTSSQRESPVISHQIKVVLVAARPLVRSGWFPLSAMVQLRLICESYEVLTN